MSRIIRKVYIDNKKTFKLTVSKAKETKGVNNTVLAVDNDYFDFKHRSERLVQEAYKKAEKIIKDAEKQAEKKIKQIEEKLHTIKTQAYDEGFKAGFDEGIKKGIQRYEAEIKSLVELKKDVYMEKEEMIKNTEKDLVLLAVKIAEKIIQKEIDRDDQYILRLIKDNLQRYYNNTKVLIRVSDKDYDTARQNAQKILKELPSINEVEFIRDITLEKGSCIMEAPSGNVNASIKQQLDILKAKLLEDFQ